MRRLGRLAGLGLIGLAGCSATSGSSGEGGGSVLANLFKYGGTTVPPAAAQASAAVECPPVAIADGAAALRRFAGAPGSESLRDQISIAHVARECTSEPDGSVMVKIGVEGRVLLGPAGGTGGRFEAPVSFIVKRGERVFGSRLRKVAVTVPAGETQASFTAVEGGFVVPPETGEFEIEVGLGGGNAAAPPRPARRRRAG